MSNENTPKKSENVVYSFDEGDVTVNWDSNLRSSLKKKGMDVEEIDSEIEKTIRKTGEKISESKDSREFLQEGSS
jgi:urease accessory protein UreE